ncbi:MAG TPA: hypothetical protein DIU05_11160 [Bacteroidetes bacterium]|jgi:hypothetical protein|nr:hypothetical protein [Bacteroidota bacterium]
MAKFLNTDSLNEWIPRLIQETERELVIIVPYIKTSDRIFKHLQEANARGVETTLVYRENKLPKPEKDKLAALDNLNLFHHPNVHAKCYYNEKYLIIGSMNLYEYSEKNNREMGVLLAMNAPSIISDDHIAIEDAKNEINTIITASTFEKYSRETKAEGFEMEIIKTQKEKVELECKEINKVFLHKKFEPVGENNFWAATCKNYFDRIDVALEHRAVLNFQFDEERIESIFKKVASYYHEYRFDGYKFYWSHYKSSITLYRDKKHRMWQDVNRTQELENFRNGIDQLISFLRQFI